MHNPVFVNQEDIPMVYQDNDYADYDTPTNTSRIDETSFTVPDTTEPTSIMRLRQKLKRDKIVWLYRYLSMTGNPGIAELDWFKTRKNLKAGNIELLLIDDDKHWQSFNNKRTGEFLTPKTLRKKPGGLNTMKNFLGFDKTPPALERSFKAATKLIHVLPTDIGMESIPPEELWSLAEEIHVKTQEASQNTDLDMREFLGIDMPYRACKVNY